MTATSESPDGGSYRVVISCPLFLDDISDYEAELADHGISYDVADVDQQLDEEELLEVLSSTMEPSPGTTSSHGTSSNPPRT